MSSLYIGVYSALYDYDAQSEEELTIHANDILYLLETSDVDEWWKVKKRVLPTGEEEVEEPVGLVPSNYIEPAPISTTATALYDYDKQTEEELSFKEGTKFNVYDHSDPDWILVGDQQTNILFGFIPSNYIEIDSSPQDFSQNNQVSISSFAPPPIHPSQIKAPEPIEPVELHPEIEANTRESQDEIYEVDRRSAEVENMEPESPPPMPSRPGASQSQSLPSRLASNSGYEQEEQLESNEHNFDGEYFTWYIDEVDGRKKRPVKFSIGEGLIIIKPNTNNPKKLKLKSASSLDNQWKLRDLDDFNHEKKHIFLELSNPNASIELHTGSKDVAEAIMTIIGNLKGAEDKGLKEVERASKSSTSTSNRKIGKLLYDFEAQGSDELMSKEGDHVYIVDETKSKDWWMCENTDTGRQGVVPSSFIEIVGTSNLEKLTEIPQRKKSLRGNGSSKGRVVEKKKSDKQQHHRSRDERDKIRERDRMQRNQKYDSSKSEESDKSLPNIHRVRTWIDSSGSFKVEAEFLGCVEGKIHLHKTNGVKIAVAATKLSIEDLEYVEKVTGFSLESFKSEVMKQNMKRARKSSGVTSRPDLPQTATAAINDIPPQKPSRPRDSTIPVTEPEYDWFEFFLNCGIDLGNCQRYSLNFSRQQMDENNLEDISPSLLRTLGLREGDILRVMKVLDNKFNRKKQTENSIPQGGLFTEASGALKNNSSSSEIFKVDAKALPSPEKSQKLEVPPKDIKFEDDAWAVKPAARSSEDLSKTSTITSQYTGSLQDLVNIKPLESEKASSAIKPYQEPSAPALSPLKATPTNQTSLNLNSQQTGSLVPAQKTGTLIPVQRTGGLVTAQPTGFMPITAQPTGFIPINTQPTGMTFGIIPLQTGGTIFTPHKTGPQVTGGFGMPPSTTFGQQPLFTPTFVPLQTGSNTIPVTSFNQPLSLQQTGSLIPTQKSGSLPQASFSQPVSSQATGGMPQTSFGQSTSFPASYNAGGFVPQSTFGQQITGGYMNGQLNNGMSQQLTGGCYQNIYSNNPFQQQQQPNIGQIAGTFGQPQTTFGMPQSQQTSSNNFALPQYQQTSFNQFSSPQNQQNMNQMTNMFQNTGISQPQQFLPTTTFGQQQTLDNPNYQPLQSQPTGTGFGNGPSYFQSQPTGRKANLNAATPDNPFGF